MYYKIYNGWGGLYLSNDTTDSNGKKVETKINGQLCSINGKIGKLWLVYDKNSSRGGHGMGSERGSNAILATKDMQIFVVKDCSYCEGGDEIVILGGYDD